MLGRMLAVANRLIEPLVVFLLISGIRWSVNGGQNDTSLVSWHALFVPYPTPACRIQHRVLATAGKQFGMAATIGLQSPAPGGSDKESRLFSKVEVGELAFDTVSQVFDFLEKSARGDANLARGLLDEYVRHCGVENFFGPAKVTPDFLNSARHVVQQAVLQVANADAVVVADSSYLRNRALLAAAESRSVPVWAYNPDGMWLRVSSAHDEVFRAASLETTVRTMENFPERAGEVKTFIANRFGGSKGLGSTPRAYVGQSRLPAEVKNKKVLCLHAFRDASNLPITAPGSQHASLFRTFFEWTDAALSIIQQEPHNWAIRAHPAGKDYPGDSEILEGLLRRYGLEDIPRLEQVSTVALLENRSPIFTLSGTIALEAAFYGYKANVASTRFPPELALASLTIEKFHASLLAPFSDAAPEINDPKLPGVASYLIYEYHRQPQAIFRPDLAQPSRDSARAFHVDCLRQQVSLLSEGFRGHGFTAISRQIDDLKNSVTAARREL